MPTPRRNQQPLNNTVARFWADIHFHEWQDFARVEPEGSDYAGLNSRLAEQMRTVLSAPPPPSPDVPCIIAGDIIHKRGFITPAVGWAVSTWLMKLREHHNRVIIFPGNHDYPLKAGADWVHALSPFIPLGVGGVEIIDVPTTVLLNNNVQLHIVPWMPDVDDWRGAVAQTAEAASTHQGPNILTTHIAVQGGLLANGHAFTGRGATADDLMPGVFDAILLGDFHRRQKLANHTWYIGAPMQHHWGDAGDTNRGYAEVELSGEPGGNPLAIKFHNLTSPQFIETRSIQEAERLCAEGHYVRLASTDSSIIETAASQGIATVREIETPTASRIELRPGASPKDVLKAYFDSDQYTGELDHGELQKLGSSILDDTASVEAERATGCMRIIAIRAFNFMGYEHLNLPVDDQGVVLLDGVNEDDPNADSNGAGKSAVLEALIAALYGRTLRDVPVSEWVRKGERCGWVAVDVQTPRGLLRITRNRGCPDVPPGLSAELNGSRIDSTARDFQQQLDEMLGMDYQTFVQVAVFGQEVPRVFAEESDAGRKELLENLCGGHQFDFPAEHTKKLAETVSGRVADYNGRLVSLNAQLTRATDELARLEREEETMEENRQRLLTQTDATIADLELRKKQAEDEKAELELKFGQIETDILNMADPDDELEEAEAAEDACGVTYLDASGKLRSATDAVTNLKMMLETVDAECPTCGRPMPQDGRPELETQLAAAEERVAKALAEQNRTKMMLDAARRETSNVRVKERQYRDKLRERDGIGSAIELKKVEVKSYSSQITAAQEERERIATYQNNITDLIEEKGKELDTLDADILRITKEKENAEGVLPYLNECVRLFGNQGLRTFLFDRLAPQITAEANKALAVLTGGSISVVVTTERRGRNEKIMLEVKNEHGAPSFKGNSGGQKRKVNLAICWAIASLARGRVNLLFIDEAFDSLDATAGLRVCDLLEQRQEETGTIIVTSHRSEFREAFPVVWTARRRDGVSELVTNQ